MRQNQTLDAGWKADMLRTSERGADMVVAAGPNFQELMALIGHLLLRWGWLEDGLRGNPIPPELERVRLIRNAICHRLVSAHTYVEGESLAHVRCRLLDGSLVSYSAADLEAAIRELEGTSHRYRAR